MHFNTRVKTSLALALAMLGGTAAHAAPLTNLSWTGNTLAYTANGSNVVNSGAVASTAQLEGLLAGSAAAPGGNVEIGRVGAAGSVTGTAGGHTFVLSSLSLSDWTAGGDALARAFITEAAAEASVDITATLGLAVNRFLNVNVGNTGLKPWQFVSDPNLSYADFSNDTLYLGLAGYFNAQVILQTLFGLPVPAGVQVSEVVKVTVDGGEAQYLRSFEATATSLTGPSVPGTPPNFTGNYAFALAVEPNEVPEPTSLALLGLGLVGLAAARRRKA